MSTDTLSTPADFPVTWRGPDDAQLLWSHDRLHYPDPVTPLEFSLIEEGVDAGLTKAARAYDIPITVHDRHINSYLYMAIEPTDLAAAEADSFMQQSSAKLRDAMAHLRSSWETEWLPEIQQHLAWWAANDLKAASLPDLRQHLAETEWRWQRLWEVHFLLFVPSKLAISEFADLYMELFEDASPFAPYKLLAGFPNKTLESGHHLWALGRHILTLPAVLHIFQRHDPTDVIEHLADCVGGPQFLAELQQYLAVHGQRADKLSLYHPYWVEDPSPVIASLQDYITQADRDFTVEMRETSEEREQQIELMRSQLDGYPQQVRDEVEFLLRAAQAGTFLSEEHGYWIDYQASYCVRRVLLTIAGALVAAGILAERDDIFYLHLSEVSALLASRSPADLYEAEYRRHVPVRKAHAARFTHVSPPAQLGTFPALTGGPDGPPDPITEMFRKIEGEMPAVVEAGNLIMGIAASPGLVQGAVKVVHVLGDATKLQPGDILVADTTAPPWTPLFASIGGLVTNSGGILSHSAVVAREFRIPAVVGASTATQRLHDGQRVEVDGNRGTVRILE